MDGEQEKVSEVNWEDLYLTIVNSVQDGIYFVDKTRTITFWSKGAQEITGYTQEEIVGKKCQHSVLNHIDEDGRPLCLVGCSLFKSLDDGQERHGRVFVRHKEGYYLPIRVDVFPVKKDGRIVGAIDIFNRDTPTVYEDSLVEHLSNIAMHDELTQMPNRRYLESVLKYKMADYRRAGRTFAVLFADVDNFSHFNNDYGHDIGDAVLKNIAREVNHSVRNDDLVGRWGGEEYVGVYVVSDPAELMTIGEKFRKLVGDIRIPYGEEELSVSVSVGITMIKDTDTIDSIVQRADALMYQSKKEGKNRVTVG